MIVNGSIGKQGSFPQEIVSLIANLIWTHNLGSFEIDFVKYWWKLVKGNYPPLNIHATMNDSSYDSWNMDEDAYGKLKIKPYYFLLLGMLCEGCYQRNLVSNMQPWRVLSAI